jgi:hypothetical protein
MTIDVEGATNVTPPSYWLQKWDAALNNWVHPITGVPYPAGTIPIGTYETQPVQPTYNSLRLYAPSLNALGENVPGVTTSSGNGYYRVIEVFSMFGNGTQTGQRCVTELITFTYTGAPIIESVVSPCDSSNGEAIVTAEVVTTASFPEAFYSVTAMEGNPGFVTMGPQTSNVFTGLSPNIMYTFTVQDACSTTNFPAFLSIRQTPAAPTGATTQVINAAAATIADIVVSGTDVRWYASETEALAGSTPLPLTTIVTSGSTYYATQTVNGCISQAALAVTVTVALGIKDVVKNELKYYPNPVVNELVLESGEVITKVAVYDLHGRLVFEKTLDANRGTVNMQALQTGSYMVKVTSGSAIKNLMVLKI